MSDREFLFEYRFDGAEWAITIFARDPAEAREKIKAVAFARYQGEVAMRVPAPGAGLIRRFRIWNVRHRFIGTYAIWLAMAVVAVALAIR